MQQLETTVASLTKRGILDKLQTAVVSATTDLAGIDDALAVLAQRTAEAEHQLAAEREHIERASAAEKLDKYIAAIDAALPGYIRQSRTLADALSEIGHWLHPEHHVANRNCRRLHAHGAEGDARRDPARSPSDPVGQAESRDQRAHVGVLTMKAAPPGWEPHRITHRIDGWIVDPENKNRIPAAVAEMIARAMPHLGDSVVAATRARMLARHKKVLSRA